MHRGRRLLALVIVTAGCGSGQVAETVATTTSPATTAVTTTTAAASAEPTEPTTPTDPSVETESDPDDTTTVTTTTVTSVAITVVPAEDCRTVADLDEPDELPRWQIVNDGVMGGRSSADAMVADSVVVFAGEIVTDGGGFSSIRLALDEPLGEVSHLLLRVRTDGRAYEVTMADAAPGRDRRVSHQAAIPATGSGAWEEVRVDLDDLEASIFGRSVSVDPFDPTAAVEVGIILADGSDGPFRLGLDRIEACA